MEYGAPEGSLGYDSNKDAMREGALDATHDLTRFGIIAIATISVAWVLLGKRAGKIVDKWIKS